MTDAPTPASSDPANEFDEFYRTTRERLLLQTFALTGDLTAARSGVRDAFVIAWHHWRKTSHAADPEAIVRTTAWRHAQRRATARRWRRDQSFDAEVCAVLDELADLSLAQRKMLLLTQLAGQTLQAAAREVGLPLDAASRELGTGASDFARVRAIDTADIPAALASLSSATRAVQWPRVTILRRAGAARQRAHTVVGVVAVAAALVVGGIAVTDSTGSRPTLTRETEQASSNTVSPPQVTLPDTELIPLRAVRSALGGSGWKLRQTNDNAEGDGRVLACQQERYADPGGEAAWVRKFRDGPPGDAESRRVIQLAEASTDVRAARRAYRRLRDWLAGCVPDPAKKRQLHQQRLVGTYVAQNVGNQSHLFLLRNDQTGSTQVVGMARTGRLVTAVSLKTSVLAIHANRQAVANLVGTAVSRMCQLPAADRCASEASLAEVPPVPAGEVPAMLSAWDLPPAGQETGPWVGPAAVSVNRNNGQLGVVSCSSVSFTGKHDGAKFRRRSLRTFVLPRANLPVEFGLTQIVAALPRARAEDFVADAAARIEGCPSSDAGAGTDVRELARRTDDGRSLTAWQLQTDLPDDRSVTYNIALLRDGTAVSSLLFVSVPRAEMSDGSFIDVAERALDRLGALPGYRKKN